MHMDTIQSLSIKTNNMNTVSNINIESIFRVSISLKSNNRKIIDKDIDVYSKSYKIEKLNANLLIIKFDTDTFIVDQRRLNYLHIVKLK